MARTIEQILTQIIAAKNADATLAATLTSNSKVAIWRLWAYIIAVCIWTLENLHDITVAAQNKYIKDTKIHSFTWYSDYGKKFQFGSALPWGEVEYDNSGLTDAQVDAQKVVKFCSCTKTPGGLMVKVAGLTGGNLAPIGAPEFAAFQQYMFRVGAAGDNLFFKNNNPDSLKLAMTIFYDPLVLNSQGKRLDGTNDTPVMSAIDNFIKAMDFNGRLVPQYLMDAIESTEGVKVASLTSAQSQYGVLAYSNIPPEGVVPDAGYLRILNPADLVITYQIWTP